MEFVGNLTRAKYLLSGTQGATLAIIYGDESGHYVSLQKGIAELMNLLETAPELMKGAWVADKVTGRAAAFLMVYGGVREVFTELISEAAVEVFSEYGVIFHRENLVPRIKNRDNTGLCPMEEAVMGARTPEEAYEILSLRLKVS